MGISRLQTETPIDHEPIEQAIPAGIARQARIHTNWSEANFISWPYRQGSDAAKLHTISPIGSQSIVVHES